jgi:DNA invertase Pin-like site-specific DNA recombinase
MTSDAAAKVTTSHLSRTAYLYVRQSTIRQVIENTESTARQYALRQRAVALGWEAERIVVIDSDQGHSGASAADREGFQRLVAEVGMGHAGIVLGLEVSRLARNNADWHQLLELCGVTGTLICDEDGLYDPCDFNDSLILGLKGTMSAAELHFIRARLRGGLLSKARRGELYVPLPVGFVHDPNGKIVLDPDTSVQAAVRHLFTTFRRTGSARATVKAFVAEGVKFPTRTRSGPHRGELAWQPLSHARVLNVLHNPHYAGVYFFGRRRSKPGPAGPSAVTVPRDQWLAFIPDAHAAYIDLETFEANQAQLLTCAKAHGPDRFLGPPREGTALLQGIAVCGQCGKRMTVSYHQRGGAEHPDYQCMAPHIQIGAVRCQNVPGTAVDEAVSRLVLDTVTPLALEVALKVQAELESRAEEADSLRRSHVERARHHAELARRRYLAVDPDNRLVADTLEADWNNALRALRGAQDDYDRATAAARSALSEAQKERVRSLVADFPALWSDPATPQRERKRMIRLLVEDVTLNKTDVINIHVRFRGGQKTSLSVPIPPKSWQKRLTRPEVLALVDTLLDSHTDAEVAELLNQTGHRSGTGGSFHRRTLVELRRDHGFPSHYERLRRAGMLTLGEIAANLGVHTCTVKKWHAAGLLTGYKANDKNEQLYQPPNGIDVQALIRQRRRRSNRQDTQSTPGGAV